VTAAVGVTVMGLGASAQEIAGTARATGDRRRPDTCEMREMAAGRLTTLGSAFCDWRTNGVA
jgi:hypothetical protein